MPVRRRYPSLNQSPRHSPAPAPASPAALPSARVLPALVPPARVSSGRIPSARIPSALISLLCAAALQPATAFAQWSGSVAAASEYRYRGIDLSEGKPSVQAGAAYDAGGWYAGGFAAGTRLNGRRGAQVLAYAGHAQRLANGLAWDAGINVVRGRRTVYGNYNELYAGVSRGGTDGSMSGRLSWSPRYGTGDARTLYGEIDAGTALGETFDAFLHVGTLRTLSGPRPPQRSDLRAGIAARLGAFGVQLAYARNNHRAYAYADPGSIPYPPAYPPVSAPAYGQGPQPSRHALILSVSMGF